MATFIVTSNRDDGRGGLTLREAIAAANASPGEDVIEFDGSVFSGGEENLIRLESTLVIRDSVTIDASRVAGVTITADRAGNDVTDRNFVTDIDATGASDLADNFRVLYVTDDNEATTLRGLTLTGGYVDVSRWQGENRQPARFEHEYESRSTAGGGILVNRGELNIIDGAVSGNAVDNRAGEGNRSPGGGIAFDPFFNPFDQPVEPIWLRLIGSTVDGNRLLGEETLYGGGILARWLNVIDSTISNNRTESKNAGGGGVYVQYQGDFTNATIHGNVAVNGNGGGVAAPNNAQFFNSTIVGNSAEGEFSRGGGFAGRSLLSWADEEAVRNEVKRFVNTLVMGNEATDGETADAFFDHNEFRDFRETNLIEGRNIINAFNDSGNIERRGSIESRALSSVFADGGALADNGGNVKTVKLRATTANVAIDGSVDFAPGSDAIGRPAQDHPGQGADRDLPGVRDLGAYELPLLRGGLPEIVDGSRRNDRLEASREAELFELGRGRDRIEGSLRALDGDFAGGFGFDDVLRVKGARFGTGDVTLSRGSLVLEIDANGRGGPEATFTLEGTFRSTTVLAERAGKNTDLTLAKLWRGSNKRDRKNGDDEARDVMDGRGGRDVLDGRGGDDVVRGGKGADRIEGGAGDDLLSGGAGRDSFRFERGFSKDVITDFDARRESLDFSGHARVDGFRDLKIRKAGDDVRVLDGDGGQILIEDASRRQIDRDVFDF